MVHVKTSYYYYYTIFIANTIHYITQPPVLRAQPITTSTEGTAYNQDYTIYCCYNSSQTNSFKIACHKLPYRWVVLAIFSPFDKIKSAIFQRILNETCLPTCQIKIHKILAIRQILIPPNKPTIRYDKVVNMLSLGY